jgi:hypothetical protein
VVRTATVAMKQSGKHGAVFSVWSVPRSSVAGYSADSGDVSTGAGQYYIKIRCREVSSGNLVEEEPLLTAVARQRVVKAD